MDTLFPWLDAPSDRLALRVGDRALSQGELAVACAHHVQALAARGLAPGDRVAVWTQPALETLVALVAHAAAGYVSVPIDPKLGDQELGHVLRDASPSACVAADVDPVSQRTAGLTTLPARLVADADAPVLG